VGDDIKDTIAMNTANVSLSRNAAKTIGTDSAQAVLMDGSLAHLYDLFDIAPKLRNSLWRSLTLVTLPTAALPWH
jgi:cation transport ATPase